VNALKRSRLSAWCCMVICLSLMISILAVAADGQSAGSITRGSRFTVTVTGQPSTLYYVWDARTFSMSGAPGDQPPVIAGGTFNLQKDPVGGPYTIGMHVTSNGKTIIDDVAPSNGQFSNTDYYATITTDANGQGTVEFLTSSNTAAQHFAIRVEDQGGNSPGTYQATANLFPRTTPPTPSPLPTASPVPSTTVPTITETTVVSSVTSAAPASTPAASLPGAAENTGAGAPPVTPARISPVPPAVGILALIAGLALAAKR